MSSFDQRPPSQQLQPQQEQQQQQYPFQESVSTVAAAVIEPDTVMSNDDYDSTFSESGSSFLRSLNSSNTTGYRYENGRRYHCYREGYYPLPNDSQEAEREETKHHLTSLFLGGRTHLAPIGDDPTAILDLGTGTGQWVLDIADEFPGARVIGTDLSPIQPTWAPPNVSFEVDDVESEWVYPPNTFDLIHVRYMLASVKDWDRLLQQAMVALKPGGYIEMIELDIAPTSDDNTCPPSSPIVIFFDLLTTAAQPLGFDLRVATKYPTLLAKNNYTDIQTSVFRIPVGPWPKDQRMKEIGWLNREQFLAGMEGIAMGSLTRGMGWSREDVEMFCAEVRRDVNNRRKHTFWQCYYVYGQKPYEN